MLDDLAACRQFSRVQRQHVLVSMHDQKSGSAGVPSQYPKTNSKEAIILDENDININSKLSSWPTKAVLPSFRFSLLDER